jgi:hypothetical protein
MTSKTTIEDFEFFTDKSYFVHSPSDFMLDGDYVLLFGDKEVMNLFHAATTATLSKEVLEQMREIVRENEPSTI